MSDWRLWHERETFSERCSALFQRKDHSKVERMNAQYKAASVANPDRKFSEKPSKDQKFQIDVVCSDLESDDSEDNISESLICLNECRCWDPPSILSSFEKFGTFVRLIDLAKSSNLIVSDYALRCITTFTGISDDICEQFVESGVLPLLSGLISSKMAISSLANIASFSDIYARRVLKILPYQNFCQMLAQSTPDFATVLTRLGTNLLRSGVPSDSFRAIASSVLNVHQSEECMHLSLSCLKFLAKSQRISHEDAKVLRIPDSLYNFFNSADELSMQLALFSIGYMIQYEVLNKNISISPIVSQTESKSADIRKTALWCLDNAIVAFGLGYADEFFIRIMEFSQSTWADSDFSTKVEICHTVVDLVKRCLPSSINSGNLRLAINVLILCSSVEQDGVTSSILQSLFVLRTICVRNGILGAFHSEISESRVANLLSAAEKIGDQKISYLCKSLSETNTDIYV